MEFPQLQAALDLTTTESIRSYEMFQAIERFVQGTQNDQTLNVLELGAGLWDAQEFVPEYFELRAVFWTRKICLHVVDHNPQVIEAVKKGSIYYIPFQYQNTKLEDTPYRYIARVSSVPNPDFWHQRYFDFSQTSHDVELFQIDFTQFNYRECHYDVIVALNSLYYLFKNEDFQDHVHCYFVKLISSLKIGGILFIDNKTCDWFIKSGANKLQNITVRELHFTMFAVTKTK